MAKPTRYIQQNFFDMYTPSLKVETVTEGAVTAELLDSIVLALATKSTVLLIEFRGGNSRDEQTQLARQLLQDRVLCHEECALFAFDLAPLALALFRDRGMRIV